MSKELTIADVKIRRHGTVVCRSDGRKIGQLVGGGKDIWRYVLVDGRQSTNGYHYQTDALSAPLDRVNANA